MSRGLQGGFLGSSYRAQDGRRAHGLPCARGKSELPRSDQEGSGPAEKTRGAWRRIRRGTRRPRDVGLGPLDDAELGDGGNRDPGPAVRLLRLKMRVTETQ